MKISVSKAEVEDLPLVAEFNAQLVIEESSRNNMSLPELEERLASWLQESIYQIILIKGDSAVLGYMVFKFSDDEYDKSSRVFIRQFFLKSEYRSRGFGRQAFELVKEQFFSSGVTMWLEVLEANPAGQRFWENLGFKTYSRVMCSN